MAANGIFPPVTYSSLFVPYLLEASKAGDNKATELAALLQQKKNNLTNGNQLKGPKKKWKQLAKNAFRDSKKKPEKGQNGVNGECQILDGPQHIEHEDLTLLQLLALNALDLTAPASDILLKNRNNNWIQLSGHEGAFAPAGPGTIWKKRPSDDSSYEVRAYEALVNDTMTDMIPKFYRDVEYNGEYFFEMQDLLHSFKNPAIMDIKMGTRTFLESEVQNSKARADLYEKMVKVDPNAPTSEEKQSQSITKLRYMLFREDLSSTSTLGFRIEGFKVEGKAPTKDLKLVKTRDEVKTVMRTFLPDNRDVYQQVMNRLRILRSKFEQSEFFKIHEVIGSSLLIIYDADKVGVWMIDFAKTRPLPQGISINHRAPWILGNHEDGYLSGLDNLICVLEDCSKD